MCLKANPALGFDPPDPVAVTGPGDAVTWARDTIPDFGWYPEVYVLFLAGGGGSADRGEAPGSGAGPVRRALRRAAWLGSATTLDDFVAWPDFSLGYMPVGGAEAVMLLICRPGEGTEPTPDDLSVFELLCLTHDARGVPLADVVLVDGRRWRSLAAL
jgi:hypothetical protein